MRLPRWAGIFGVAAALLITGTGCVSTASQPAGSPPPAPSRTLAATSAPASTPAATQSAKKKHPATPRATRPARPSPRSVAPRTRRPSSAPPAAQPACHPLTSGGDCYRAGEYCRKADHGASGVAENGDAITCENRNGWRWESA